MNWFLVIFEKEKSKSAPDLSLLRQFASFLHPLRQFPAFLHPPISYRQAPPHKRNYDLNSARKFFQVPHLDKAMEELFISAIFQLGVIEQANCRKSTN